MTSRPPTHWIDLGSGAEVDATFDARRHGLPALTLVWVLSRYLSITCKESAQMKKLASLALVAALGIGLSACSESGTSTGSESASKAPAASAESAKPKAESEKVPTEYKSALRSAENYSEMMHMSKAGLYDQLTSPAGDKFSKKAAQYAVDNIKADWNANALASAKNYQETMAMSPEAIRSQLTSSAGDQFTKVQADYAVKNLD